MKRRKHKQPFKKKKDKEDTERRSTVKIRIIPERKSVD